MKTVILCGGRGFRLQEETEYKPKPLVAVGGKPILWHIMRMYSYYGIREFVLCLGYRGEMVKDYFANYDMMNEDFTVVLGKRHTIVRENSHNEQDYCVTLADTGLETLTGGRIKRIERYIDEDNFMVTYGDGLADLDIGKLIEFHLRHGKLATVTAVHPISRWGVLGIDEDGRVTKFSEKPIENDWISAGFFVFNRKIFDYIEDDKSILERNPLHQISDEGQLMAFKHEGFFYTMDTYKDYVYLNELWDKGEAKWIK
ncbi:MAG: glucose-1-phosphate cytidylyltransferase [Phycisphaerae bacterium]|jgi:glucose-1-phosphate cytidylyltransferase